MAVFLPNYKFIIVIASHLDMCISHNCSHFITWHNPTPRIQSYVIEFLTQVKSHEPVKYCVLISKKLTVLLVETTVSTNLTSFVLASQTFPKIRKLNSRKEICNEGVLCCRFSDWLEIISAQMESDGHFKGNSC